MPEPTRPAFGCMLDANSIPLKLTGKWVLEPKFNGWRIVVDTTSGRMYNRHGNRLSEEGLFREAVEEVSYLFKGELLDCEGLGKRGKIGKGRLIMLDRMVEGNYFDRTEPLRLVCPTFSATDVMHGKQMTYSCPWFENNLDDLIIRLMHWKTFNDKNDCIFYEGTVAKRIDKEYEHGETNNWRKFRFTYES